jgi:hypothetical protein
VSWVGGAEWFDGRVGPMAEDSRRLESAIDCRIDPMSDHWPLLVAEPLDGERLVNSQLRPRGRNHNDVIIGTGAAADVGAGLRPIVLDPTAQLSIAS